MMFPFAIGGTQMVMVVSVVLEWQEPYVPKSISTQHIIGMTQTDVEVVVE